MSVFNQFPWTPTEVREHFLKNTFLEADGILLGNLLVTVSLRHQMAVVLCDALSIHGFFFFLNWGGGGGWPRDSSGFVILQECTDMKLGW